MFLLNFDPLAMKFNYDYHDGTCTAIFTKRGFSLYAFFIDNDIHESIAASAMLKFAIFHLRFCCGHSHTYMETWSINNLEQYIIPLIRCMEISLRSDQRYLVWRYLCLWKLSFSHGRTVKPRDLGFEVYFSSSSGESGDVIRCCVLGGAAEMWYGSFYPTSKLNYASIG